MELKKIRVDYIYKKIKKEVLIMKQLTIIEQGVLELISRDIEHPTKCSYISEVLHIDKRSIRAIIVNLIKKCVPIVASRGTGSIASGYYIPSTKEELEKGLLPLKSQAREMQERISNLYEIDIHTWQKAE